MLFYPEFKKMVKEEGYLPDQVLNVGMTGLAYTTCSLALAIAEYKYRLKC
jgi:hypothetical protein